MWRLWRVEARNLDSMRFYYLLLLLAMGAYLLQVSLFILYLMHFFIKIFYFMVHLKDLEHLEMKQEIKRKLIQIKLIKVLLLKNLT